MCPGVQLLDESRWSNLSTPFFLKNLANVRSHVQALTCDTSFFCQCFCYPDSKDYPFITWTNFATISQKCNSICQKLLRRLGFSQNRCFTFISFLCFIRSFSGQIGLICPSFPSCWRYYTGRIVHSLYVVVWQTARKSCVHTGTRRWREPSRSGVTFHLVECLIFLFF